MQSFHLFTKWLQNSEGGQKPPSLFCRATYGLVSGWLLLKLSAVRVELKQQGDDNSSGIDGKNCRNHTFPF
jgi:hypothetical protein